VGFALMTMAHRSVGQRFSAPRRQRGVVLIIALVMLITITFAGLALFRQIGLGAVIVGNLAFKQGATSAADRGVEQARTWLQSPALASIPRLQGTVADVIGYFPAGCYKSINDWGDTGTDSSCAKRDQQSLTDSSKKAFDPLSYAWTDATSILAAGPDTNASGVDSAGNTVRYVIHRMCNMDGSIIEFREFADGTNANQTCSLASGGRYCLDQGGYHGDDCLPQSMYPYYRVTARVQGPRNTLSYVEVVIY
jgi:Tfp pilus assembly protein PilX